MLTAVEIPENYRTPTDAGTDCEIIDRIGMSKFALQKNPHDFMVKLHLEFLHSIATAFSRAVRIKLYEVLERYSVHVEDPKYLIFCDEDEKVRSDYETECVDCFKLPEGRIITCFEERGYPFTIKDGVVYQRRSGPLKLEKRTQKAKKMKALPDYPLKKLYRSLDKYAKEYCGYVLNEETGKYGYLYNSDGIYDWFSIGGRWPFAFLVRKTCQEYSLGERAWSEEEDTDAPQGYIWVAAARKKDIEWTKMLEHNKICVQQRYEFLTKILEDGIVPEDFHGSINDEGITQYGESIIRKGETLQEFFARRGISEKYKYPLRVYSFVSSKGYLNRDHEPFSEIGNAADSTDCWRVRVDEFIDSFSDDTVLVGIDYHI
jgi:hypothetical protein